MKRFFDIVVSGLALISISLPLAVIGLLVRLRLGSPVLFIQERPGKHGRLFRMYKFRTMTNERGPDGQLLPDAQRLTSLGRFLRSTSLDELPELWNVLKGDMSLVGPRPLAREYLCRYTPEQARRHEVKPGITGLAQVSGRNGLSWKRRLELDVEYVDRMSIGLDLRILALTVVTVLRREGASRPGQGDMPDFLLLARQSEDSDCHDEESLVHPSGGAR